MPFMSYSLKAPILFPWVEHGDSNISILPSRHMAQPVPLSILIQCLQCLVWVLICFSNMAYHTSRTLLASPAIITLSRPITLGSKVGINLLSPTTPLERSFLQTTFKSLEVSCGLVSFFHVLALGGHTIVQSKARKVAKLATTFSLKQQVLFQSQMSQPRGRFTQSKA